MTEGPLVVNLLRQKLFHSGIREEHVVRDLGVGKTYLDRLIRGDVLPSLALALRIARYLCLDVEDIWHLAPEEGRPLYDILVELDLDKAL